MTSRFYGITSLVLAAAAIGIASVAMFRIGVGSGLLYLALCLIAAPIVLYTYCSKCPSRNACGHVFPGQAAALLFRNRTPGPYTRAETSAMVLALLTLLIVPQIALSRFPIMLIVFWVAMAAAVVQIRTSVCRECNNVHCPLKSRSGMPQPAQKG
jgi:hypothetical protein